MNQSVKKTFQILEYIASNGNFVRLNDVAQALALKKNTAHGFLDSLKELGYLVEKTVKLTTLFQHKVTTAFGSN
ncbi:helix-turn-helix domain-containing protein [Flavobacterium sp. N2469]|uniref:helix-turn-helix domain-containing protein n=1 Tax=Flavobacterium TaxID=237 RepID=UPI0039B4369B